MAKRSRRPSRPVDAPLRVLGYVRVSTEEQAREGHSLAGQGDALRLEADRRGWELVDIVADEGISAATLSRRPGVMRALELLEAGQVDALMVTKADRLSRSLVDLAGLIDRSRAEGWALVLLDLGVDVTTPAGELAASVVGAAAQYERRMAGQRTREGLAAARAKGVRLGRPRALPDDVLARIVHERAAGATLTAIATRLERDRVPTAHGGARWYPATVGAVLRSQAASKSPPAPGT